MIARRRRGLRVRLAVLAGIALTLVAIWALTGAPNAWPVWPLLGLALIGGLDAWLVLAGVPPLESQVARSATTADGRSAAGARCACGRAPSPSSTSS